MEARTYSWRQVLQISLQEHIMTFISRLHPLELIGPFLFPICPWEKTVLSYFQGICFCFVNNSSTRESYSLIWQPVHENSWLRVKRPLLTGCTVPGLSITADSGMWTRCHPLLSIHVCIAAPRWHCTHALSSDSISKILYHSSPFSCVLFDWLWRLLEEGSWASVDALRMPGPTIQSGHIQSANME